MADYVVSVDQSTQGTKALLFDAGGKLICRSDLPHRQIINDQGWVSHDPEEIMNNTIRVVKDLAAKAGIDKNELRVLGISNQRETSVAWDKDTGKPVCDAIVWQCSRAKDLCEERFLPYAETVKSRSGINLSPYFPASKWAWMFDNVPDVREKAEDGRLADGTIDSWLVWNLTGGKEFRTDYSNASRTELFNINTLEWDDELLKIFGIPRSCMAQVTDSDGDYGTTDFGGWLDVPIPIRSVMGDSHGALFGQGCLEKGMIKATYGTGSSIMMNIGETPVFSDAGIVTSLAWSMGGKVNYVLENNINYTGAVITWLKDDLKLITSPAETGELAKAANPSDTTYFVPAFSGLGAPYWDSEAKASISGMTRVTGKNEVVRAAVDSIAYQIADAVRLMGEACGTPIGELRVDGGPTRNDYLMQLQSDLTAIPVRIPDSEELSGIGAAYAAGLAQGIFDESVFSVLNRVSYEPKMDSETREQKLAGWKDAVAKVRTH
ncbi:MAG: glycerol kinase GlpK [Lachnospiraceae bacterium]|nr:glycerol kinase GlpK [Lachnospiraceae bacterium]